VLCDLGAYEDRIHLFFECNFSRRIWTYLQIDWIPPDDIHTIMQAARASFGKPFFMEVVILDCRNIWLLQNGKIFVMSIPLLRSGSVISFMIFLSSSLGLKLNF
jgi:hypothetical protein